MIADRFGQVELLNVNHHDSSHSSNQHLIDVLNPEASFISCGKNSYGHPDQEVLDHLLMTGDVYFTNMCDETRNYGGARILNGDIVIQSYDGISYVVLLPTYLPMILAY